MKMDDVKEVTQMSGPEGTTTFAYDDWGRMTSKSRSSYTADYAYGPSSMLWEVESDFPGEGDATYLYGGDGKRRNRVEGANETWYNWAGWSVMNEEDDADGTGNLTRWYMGRNGAHADGANPSTGTWRYYTHDHLSSTRNVYDSSKNRLASYDYTPYGEVYASAAFATANHTFTGHAWDSATGMYFAPFRWYEPEMGRWITPDPLGSTINAFTYVGSNPLNSRDPSGLILQMLAGGLLGGIIGAVGGGMCVWAAGGSLGEIAAGATVGAGMGAVTGLVVTSGVGLVAAGIYGTTGGALGGLAVGAIAEGIQPGPHSFTPIAINAVEGAVVGGTGAIAGGFAATVPGGTGITVQIATQANVDFPLGVAAAGACAAK